MKRLILTALAAAAALSGATAQETQNLPPLMGWSSWNTFGIDISEQIIKDQAAAMVSQGLKDAGYLYCNTDDGFFGQRDVQGRMQAHATRFPGGMKPVADYIHSLGLKAGIYSDAGVNTCGSHGGDYNGVGAGLYGHERQDIDLYMRQWGFDFIKIDYCGGIELGLDERTQYGRIHDAVVATGRKDLSVNICRWAFPGTWAADYARSWRTTGDIRDAWPSVKGILMENLYLSAFATGGHYNDMDMLEIGRSLTPDEEITHFGLWCIMASPLLIGCDMTKIRPASLELLKNPELIALNQDPLHRQAYVADVQDSAHYVLVKDICTDHGTTRAAAFFNPTDTAYTFTIDLARLELGGKVSVRDLVLRKDLGKAKGQYTCTVAAHGTHLCRLEAQHRLEASEYEAEWAWLPLYNELGRDHFFAKTRSCERASGLTVVTNIGGRKENSIVWRDIYSHQGGDYTLTVHYISYPNYFKQRTARNATGILPAVNGTELPFLPLERDTRDSILTASLPITLRAGLNTVELTNPSYWAPDIDKITLTKRN